MFLEHDDAIVLFVKNQLPSLSHYLTLDKKIFFAQPEELKI